MTRMGKTVRYRPGWFFNGCLPWDKRMFALYAAGLWEPHQVKEARLNGDGWYREAWTTTKDFNCQGECCSQKTRRKRSNKFYAMKPSDRRRLNEGDPKYE